MWSFESPLADVLRAFKFNRLEGLGSTLARSVAPSLEAYLANSPMEIDLVIPIPLHFIRRIKRGYNQAERLARPLAKDLGKPFAQPLVRRRWAPAQARLSRTQRLKNLKKAFRVSRPSRITGQNILLVDDVVTTGSTLRAAAEALREAGSGPVLAFAAARTPEVSHSANKKRE